MEAEPELGRPLLPGLPHVRAEGVYAVRYEMAQTLEDVVSRRTRVLLFARDTTGDHALSLARLLAPELGWSTERVEHEAAALLMMVANERDVAGIPDGQPGVVVS